MTNFYDDIIHLPHYVSATHPQMPAIDRAAQFAPFAALTGYDAAVKEAARLTDKRLELDESVKEALNMKLQIIAGHLEENLEVSITYFQPDMKKDGGAYLTSVGSVKRVDDYMRLVIMSDGTVIPIEEISSIAGQIFDATEFNLLESE